MSQHLYSSNIFSKSGHSQLARSNPRIIQSTRVEPGLPSSRSRSLTRLENSRLSMSAAPSFSARSVGMTGWFSKLPPHDGVYTFIESSSLREDLNKE